MRKYGSFVRLAVASELSYRGVVWIAVLGTAVRVILLYFLWKAVFARRTYVGDYSFDQMVGYVVLAALLVGFNAFGAGRTLSLMIARGEIATELVRPYSIIGRLLSYNAGQKIAELARAGIALLFLGLLITPSLFHGSVGRWALFVVSVALGGLIIQLFDIAVASIAFWTSNTWGLWMLRNSIIALFAGALLPLSLFPLWFQQWSNLLPFAASMYEPIQLFLTDAPTTEWLSLAALQMLWILIMAVVATLVVRVAVRRVEVFGG